MLTLAECEGRAAEAGAKAELLARALAAGLPVLDGVLLLPEEEVEPEALAAALFRLGGERFAVRSSSSIEDRPGTSGAGVFESVIDVRGIDAVRAAIERVRRSAWAEPAVAYLAARGIAAAAVRVAVLVQPLARAERFGVARSDGSDGFLTEERPAGEPEWGDVEASAVARGAVGPFADGLRALEGLVGGPADIEYARGQEGVTFLQARPTARAPAAVADAAFEIEGSWRRDAEHNPEPLSLAQSGLVEWVEELGVGARQRVLGGYLFVERAPARGAKPLPLAELRRRFDEELRPDCEARLAAVEVAAELAPTLLAYRHVYARYVAEIGPTLAHARRELDRFLWGVLRERLADHGELLGGLGGATLERDQALWELGQAPAGGRGSRLRSYLDRFGAYAPAWDVAALPDDEAPARVLEVAARLAKGEAPRARQQVAAARAREAEAILFERLDRTGRRAWRALFPLVRSALPVAEDDDALFFRAQRAVRRALLRIGRVLREAGAIDQPTDVFELPLPLLRQGGIGNLRAQVVAAGAAHRAALQQIAPDLIEQGRPHWRLPEARTILRGQPTAGRARGRALILRPGAPAPTTLAPGSVLVVPAILPTLTHLLASACALVTLHGGATSHGATLAREYGVPAVLGIGPAHGIVDGNELYVDGSTGRVYLISSSLGAVGG